METSLAVLVFFPFLTGILVYVVSREDGPAAGGKRLQSGVVVLTAAAEFLAIAVLSVIGIFCGEGAGEQVVFLQIPEICGLGISFVLDGFRCIYVGIAAFMWLICSIFSLEYFQGHKNKGRFYLFWLWTLGATLGVFLSADLFTTFLFFEVMSLTSYVWVAQEEDKASLRAAGTYLAVAVLAGLVMLMGIFLLQYYLGTLEFGALAQAVSECGNQKILYVAGTCILFGFGAKAGVFPLHIWLPKAHPVAPAPASALLSGILTKTGIYGILIISCNLFPFDWYWGCLVLMLGVITMLGGALLAVFSIDLKRTLACSSMSQIGFILVGIGMFGLSGSYVSSMGDISAVSIAITNSHMFAVHGVFLHMVNHSLIKLVLFLAAGVIQKNVHSIDLNVIRGFGRKKPLLAGCFLTGALAIGGIPLFGGYISKTLLHESIVAYGGGDIVKVVEWLFLISGGLTVAYMAKLFIAVFVEKNEDTNLQKEYDEKIRFWNSASAFAVVGSACVLLVWGLLPYGLMDRAARLAEGFFGCHVFHVGETIHSVQYFHVENLKGGFISIAIGAAVYLFFIRKVLMKKEHNRQKQSMGKSYVNLWPQWLDLEELVYRPLLLKVFPLFLGVVCRIFDSAADGFAAVLRRTIYRNSPIYHERTEGNVFTEILGKVLNLIQKIGNHTWKKKNTSHIDYVHLAALKNEEFKENNLIIRRSLSFGLLLFCVGLSLTLLYLIWW